MIKKNLLQIGGVGFGGLVVGIVLGVFVFSSGNEIPNPAMMPGQLGQAGTQNGQRKVQIGGGVSGEILNIDEKSITLKMRDGGSRIVFFTNSTPVYKSVAGTSADLKVGAQISTFGNSGSDGSIIAESIQIRDALSVSGVK